MLLIFDARKFRKFICEKTNAALKAAFVSSSIRLIFIRRQLGHRFEAVLIFMTLFKKRTENGMIHFAK
jgi:hypothetical protein